MSNFVFWKSCTNIFRAKRSQVNDGRAVHERIEKTKHEVNRAVRRKNAEVSCARPQRIQSRKRHALLQIVFVGHHAAFGSAAGAGGVDDGGDIAALAWDEGGVARSAKFFPALHTVDIRV